MQRANIFQQYIPNNSQKEIVDLILNFNHALVEVKSNQLCILNKNDTLLKFDIELFEKDMFTATYLGKFNNGFPFRFIQPIGIALDGVNSKYNSKGAFSLGSINPDGFAIHFILTEQNDVRSNNITCNGENEHIQKLIEGAFMSLQSKLDQKFIEITKRLIQLIKENPSEIKKYNDGAKLANLMKANLSIYDSFEQKTICQI